MSMNNKKKYDYLQMFRGLAALSVVLHHAAMSTDTFVGRLPMIMQQILSKGYLGVDFFFVLSGFIIYSSHHNDEKGILSLKTFVIKRFIRIFPPYWPISLTLLASYSLLPGLSQGNRGEISLISSILLVPDSAPPALSIAWTLIHEMIFYMFFASFFLSSRVFFVCVIAWFSWIVVELLFAPLSVKQYSPVLAVFLNPINIEFILGMFVAFIHGRFSDKMLWCISLLGMLILFFLLPFVDFSNDNARLVIGFMFSFVVLAAVLFEKRKAYSRPSWLVKLGDASYSIFLIHNPILSVVSRLFGKICSSWSMGMVFGLSVSIISGYVYHVFVEKPFILKLRRLLLTPAAKSC